MKSVNTRKSPGVRRDVSFFRVVFRNKRLGSPVGPLVDLWLVPRPTLDHQKNLLLAMITPPKPEVRNVSARNSVCSFRRWCHDTLRNVIIGFMQVHLTLSLFIFFYSIYICLCCRCGSEWIYDELDMLSVL